MSGRWITALVLAVVIGLPGALIMSSQPSGMTRVLAQNRDFDLMAIDGRRVDDGLTIWFRPDALELHGPCGVWAAPMRLGPLRQQISFGAFEAQVNRACGNFTFSLTLEALSSVSSYGFRAPNEPDAGIELDGDHVLTLSP